MQLNLKPEAPLSALLPTNNEIERDSWEDVSTIELRGVLSTAEIENIHFSGWKPTNWNVTSSCTSYAIFKTSRRYFLSSPPPSLFKNISEELESLDILRHTIFRLISLRHYYSNSFHIVNNKSFSRFLKLFSSLIFFQYIHLQRYIWLENNFCENIVFFTYRDILLPRCTMRHGDNRENLFTVTTKSRDTRTCSNRCDATGNQMPILRFTLRRIDCLSVLVCDSRLHPLHYFLTIILTKNAMSLLE